MQDENLARGGQGLDGAGSNLDVADQPHIAEPGRHTHKTGRDIGDIKTWAREVRRMAIGCQIDGLLRSAPGASALPAEHASCGHFQDLVFARALPIWTSSDQPAICIACTTLMWPVLRCIAY